MGTLLDKEWWSAVLVRVIKTMAETAIAYIGSAAVLSEISWATALSATLVSAIVCILMNLQGLPELEDNEPYTEDEDDINISIREGD